MAAGWPDPGAAFTAAAQVGTETAVLIRIVTAWARSPAAPSAAGTRHAGASSPRTSRASSRSALRSSASASFPASVAR